MSRRFSRFWKGGLGTVLLSVAATTPAVSQVWPQFYDPMAIRTLHLSMSNGDWSSVKNDGSFTYEAPCSLWMPGEGKILAAVRRKSGNMIGSGKVSLKIDINQYTEQSWHGVKKLSLENGADTSTLHEGFAWYLHRVAWTPGGYPYMPPLANWAKLYVNGEYYGIYTNVEQVDRRFLEQRGIWLSDDTWLYKQNDIGSPATIEFGPLTNSPTYTALCYSPFPPNTCPTPAPATLVQQLNDLIDMQGMLTLGAVDAWCWSPDNLFAKGKNHYFSDSRYRKRFYYPWDIDASFSGLNPSRSIYDLGTSAYETVILDNPSFRNQYSSIMQTLVTGPFATASLTSALNSLETVLLPEMSADPYNPVGASEFTALRNYISARNPNVINQLGSLVDVPMTPSRGLLPAHPNPTNAGTTIAFRLDRRAPVRVNVYDAQGARVRNLVDDHRDPGVHNVEWEGNDADGRRVKSGVYFISCTVDGRNSTQRLVVFR